MKQVTLTAKATVPNKVADILQDWADDPNHQLEFIHTLVVDGEQQYVVRAPIKVRAKDTE